MNKTMLAVLLAFVAAGSSQAQSLSFSMGDPSVDAGLNELNLSAKLDLGAFYAEVTLQWGVPRAELQAKASILQPAELYLAAALSKLSGKSFSFVVEAYRADRAKGWGALARSLGIKPGSKEFKALKDKLDASRTKLKKK